MSWNLAGGVALVTGAASGIGRSLAKFLAREKMSLALADVDEHGLLETAREIGGSQNISTHVVDVGEEKSMEKLGAEVLAGHRRLTLLVNNAGVALSGTLDELSTQDIGWLMRVNFWGVVYGVKVFLPLLKSEPRAHIVNVSSLLGLIASAGNSAYCASKFAVRGLSEVLQHELEGSTVGVTCVHPGTVRTQLSRNARIASGVKRTFDFESARDYLHKSGRTSPETVAERIVEGVKRGQTRILIGGDAIWGDRLQRLFPGHYESPLNFLRKLRKSLPR